MKKKTKCYIYTRVSTAIQVDGYSLDAQKDKLRKWAKKADWYDPSVATEDEYLGKRQHEKSAEEKEKTLQDSIRKSWYW